jgi:hypothetical protein
LTEELLSRVEIDLEKQLRITNGRMERDPDFHMPTAEEMAQITQSDDFKTIFGNDNFERLFSQRTLTSTRQSSFFERFGRRISTLLKLVKR